jgi:glycosyltransferase involved in cell wall biosynthesis
VSYKTGIVVFNNGAFGGAARRYTNLFIYLNNLYRGKFYYFVNPHLYNQIVEIFPKVDTSNIIIIESGDLSTLADSEHDDSPRLYKDASPDPYEIDERAFFIRKIYWYYKNKYKQFALYKKIERFRKELDIKVFYGVFSGVLPLAFYLNSKKPRAGIIFSDMDSWFSEIHSDMKKLWYRRYYSFNYMLENCDMVDFLSPYISEGVKKLGVKIKDECISVSPCSFADYSECEYGQKKNSEIAFCSRLEPDKNPIMFLEAAKEILKKHPEVKFHLLGEGSLVNEIKNFIDHNNLSGNISFQFHKNPPVVFRDTSIFVSLQKNTNYPSQSVLEAMACGNAIIASDTGDTRLFINSSNGVLINLSVNALVNAMESLLSNRDLAKSLGINARSDVLKNHTVEKYTSYLTGLLDRVYKKHF